MAEQNRFPGGSRSRVNRAGENVRAGTASDEDFQVIDEWRAAHSAAINTFQAFLRNRTRGTDIVVAQRLKRKTTIIDKLRRHPKMELSRMDDVAGCRIIFSSIEDLYKFRASLHQARFSHRRRNDVDKYDYIKTPNRDTGYRGIHDIYVYDANSDPSKAGSGILIELQYRTLVQHSWATAVEVIGKITDSQPKFRRGDARYQRAMALASEILARAFEERPGPFPYLGSRDVVKQFLRLDQKIGLLNSLRSVHRQQVPWMGNISSSLLIFSNHLEVKPFSTSMEAMKELFALELKQPTIDIVLVESAQFEDIPLAFRNYFTDVADFLRLVKEGCSSLLN